MTMAIDYPDIIDQDGHISKEPYHNIMRPEHLQCVLLLLTAGHAMTPAQHFKLQVAADALLESSANDCVVRTVSLASTTK